ncbi:MAG TPA: hypothetical protein VNA57_05920 [Acidimicrobiales bacterium]|nr:hypothetical protein [Acidimicrobiales bacterium]
MAKEKATITVDRAKLAEARSLLGVSSASAAIDIALTEVVRRARLRRDVEAYRRVPATEQEVALAEVHPDFGDLTDDTDWDSEWPDHQ